MAVGTVKFFNTQKGFGFIAPEGGGKDVFVHISALERSGMSHLSDGAKVSFDVERDQRGRDNATNLRTHDASRARPSPVRPRFRFPRGRGSESRDT